MAEPTEYEALGRYIEEEDDLLIAPQSSTAFWDNLIDDAVWDKKDEANKSPLLRRNPMIIGRIGSDLRPIVPIVVQGADGREAKLSCLLSTGFGEALLLPSAEIAALGLPQEGTRPVQFPDGSRIEATVHPAKILLAGEAQDVEILGGGVEPRMGLKLLDGCRVSMRFVEGGAISIERS